MFKWLRYMLSPNTALHEAAQLQKAADKGPRLPNWTERALSRLDEWESCINALCFSGVIGTGDAVLEVEHISRIRKELGFRVNDAEWSAARDYEAVSSEMAAMVAGIREHQDRARTTAREWQDPKPGTGWKPGVEHQQPHPVKENPDGTIYYKGWVYRKIGDHGPKTPREQRRRHWKKAGKAA